MRLQHGTAAGQWDTEKILPQPWERLAVVYGRHSTRPQGREHQESTRRQDGLVRRAVAWGGPESRGLVIDADLGRSGPSAEGRHGFHRLVAEGGVDHVGRILGGEMSRVARSSTDGQHLLESGARFAPLIADLEGIDDPRQDNERLWWGFKGPRREAAQPLRKPRLSQGPWPQARRGARRFALPLGDVHHPAGEGV
jgi:hypothetical protein